MVLLGAWQGDLPGARGVWSGDAGTPLQEGLLCTCDCFMDVEQVLVVW